MLLVPVVGWALKVKNFTFVGSATGSGSSINIGTVGVQAGDFCVIFNTTAGSTTEVIPSGFTPLQSTSVGSSGRAVISAKKLTGSETTVSGLSAGTPSWIVAVFRPDGAYSSFTGHNGGAEGTTGNPVSQSMNVSGVPTPIILLGQMYSNDGGSGYRTIDVRTTSPTMTELAGTTGQSPQGQYAHYTLYNAGSTPANTTYDMDDEGQNILQSVYVTFS